ncbi:cytochrome c family protein [Oscillochloris trichoides DG-6]|uniref:Cytochrome c family protein n=1 Tax=Oscillochloris trichoides DG-6 TaxID=765420 RepID=E1II49_9CHLR|nr:cytochrome c3 family protein [Oscillochloris trichoides]EFO79167.1 cytochrome c family protein [Oscillochloris trichoides DG-6]
MNRLGCLTPFGIGAGIITIIALIVTGWLSGGTMFSPGPLSAQQRNGIALGGVTSHAAIGGDCGACHTSPWQARTMADACLECHSDIQSEIGNPATLHGALPDATKCMGCHVEHRGESASLTDAVLNEFPHAQLGFALDAHQYTADGQAFACADCHTPLTQNPRPSNAYDGAAVDCVGCHTQDQPTFMQQHQADFGSACMDCHDGVDRYSNFDHASLRFPLEGLHQQVECGMCHTNTRTPEQFASTADTCLSCHQEDDVHEGSYGTDCAACHTPSGWAQVTFDHSRTAFPLTGAHMQLECVACHKNQVYQGTPTTCVGCHAEPQEHLGQFGTDCAACHVTSNWKNVIFEHTFPLNHGGEGQIACATCHTNPPPNQYTTYTCYNCHAHNESEIRSKHLEEGISDYQDCMRCHPDGRE